ncbi:AAA family ATPase [Aquisalimonas sp. 2447]|uniref:ExeA family protein n=1 Tax=Aquisalimonas sp. 2447 TaxID=2740807 RepID=UPI00143274FD|nr:AAA family ATPase [Aquisalimonas sp. 2447]QIT55555.1 AAA family ATPase [Aquisalimonas sp. 2447]
MYLEHFGLDDFPFSLSPDTTYFCNLGAWQEALNVVLVALDGGEGFIKVTGEVGTGKTMLCRTLLNRLEDRYTTAWVPNPYVSANGLRLSLADELGLKLPGNAGQHRVLRELTAALLQARQAERPVVLVLDEAQSMPEDTLEALRLLTNLETERAKLLQVVMFGQPELDARLSANRWRQLRQRITFSYTLGHLDCREVRSYVGHRLAVAGSGGGELFSGGAMDALCTSSAGLPRLVNILAHKALLAAYGEGRDSVGWQHVLRAARDTDEALQPGRSRRSWWAASVVATLVVIAAGIAHWHGLGMTA